MAVKLSFDRDGPAVWLVVDMGRALAVDGGQIVEEDAFK
jgi:hypothetical protein